MNPAAVVMVMAALLLSLTGCAERPAPTPRQHAYPRLQLYPATYSPVELRAASLTPLVNDSAQVEILSPEWFNIVYPAYGVKVNCTISPYAPDVMANRRERIDRNLGGAVAEAAYLPAGVVVVAPGALRTPVQLLATDSARWVLSGVAVSNFPPDAPADSVAPVIDALAKDLTILVNSL